MKLRESKELRAKSATELAAFVRDAREKLRALRLDLSAGKVKNVGTLHALRKDIARALTFLAEARREEETANGKITHPMPTGRQAKS